MKNTLYFVAAGLASWLLVALVFTLLVSCAGCAYDPISGPDRKHDVRPNPYGLTNAPARVPGAGLPRQ